MIRLDIVREKIYRIDLDIFNVVSTHSNSCDNLPRFHGSSPLSHCFPDAPNKYHDLPTSTSSASCEDKLLGVEIFKMTQVGDIIPNLRRDRQQGSEILALVVVGSRQG